MKTRTAEEILDWHLHQMGKHTVGLNESDLYECALKAINEALTIPNVVWRSEQLVCDICEEPLEKVLGKVCENTMCDRHR